MDRETAYADYQGGRWELFIYSEGRRVVLKHAEEWEEFRSYCRKNNYRLVVVLSSPEKENA